jgi:hypothetical protein
MSATPEAVWGNTAQALSIQNEADTSVPIAGIREVTITPTDELTELYTMNSNFREDAKRYEHSVNVEITYANFSLEFAQEWLGGEGSTATASQDSSDPALFAIEEVQTSADGGFERTTTVEDVIFPEFPIVDASYGEFEEYGLSGSGSQISNLADTSGV